MPYCNRCGAAHELGEESCVNCQAVLPKLTLGDSRVELSPGRGRHAAQRVVAGAIDLGVALALGALAMLALRRVPLPLAFVMQRSPLAVLPLLVPSVYLLLKDGIDGKSVGKLVAGLVLWDAPGRHPAGLFDSINRNWPFAIPIVGPSLLSLVAGIQIVIGRPRRIGDRETIVVLSDAESLAACASV